MSRFGGGEVFCWVWVFFEEEEGRKVAVRTKM